MRKSVELRLSIEYEEKLKKQAFESRRQFIDRRTMGSNEAGIVLIHTQLMNECDKRIRNLIEALKELD